MKKKQDLFKGRDKRNKNWFWIDNEYLNGYAKIFGAVGTAIYVSLCRHADNETQQCFPAQKTIAKELKIGERTVRNYLKLFEKYSIISVEREKDPKTKRWKNNVYTLLDKSSWLKPEAIVADGKPEANDDKSQRQMTTKARGNQRPNNKTHNINKTHINKTHIIKFSSNEENLSSEGKKINEFIDKFKAVNPTYYLLFGRKVQREAIKRMLKHLGEKNLAKLLDALPNITAEPYAPKITTPKQLEENLGKLMTFIRQKQVKSYIPKFGR